MGDAPTPAQVSPILAAVYTWSRIVDVAGHLMEPTDHYPTRFRVRAFPDEAQLAEIGVAKF